MKTTVLNLKNNTQRIIVSLLLLVIASPAYSQSNFEDRYFTVEILSAVLFVAILGVWMLIALLKQKSRDNKKIRQHLHMQRRHNQLSHIKY